MNSTYKLDIVDKIQYELDNLNSPIAIKETKFVI